MKEGAEIGSLKDSACMKAVDVHVNCPSAVCIEFPGQVRNVDKAVEMLGGYPNITKALAQPSPVLSCRPRPQVPA
jgi:general transcription factor 3C polypeptide 5 (transcription factor C subunit 1)